MAEAPRHQCIIYHGSPAQYLPRLAAVIKEKLAANVRCLYFNSPAMVAGMRSYLFAADVDVVQETERGSLMLVANQDHLIDGSFDGKHMLKQLEDAVTQALRDGFAGLWATGDMSWECGPEKNHRKLLEYEWGLEELFRRQPALTGICQYHIESLPADISRQALIAHKSVFVSETISRLNPFYIPREKFSGRMPSLSEVRNGLRLFVQEEPQ